MPTRRNHELKIAANKRQDGAVNAKNNQGERGLKCRKLVSQRRPPANHNGHRKPTIHVAIRQQTPEEEREFETALDLFLAEFFRDLPGHRRG